jgi:hypothetical protein
MVWNGCMANLGEYPANKNCLVVEPYPSEKSEFVSWDEK